MSIYREYDIRGIYPQELNEKSVKLIGYFLGKEILLRGLKNVAIGFDARSHSPQLCEYLTSGFNHAGVEVFHMGLVATPVNYFSNYCEPYGIDSSVMITGSHNPSEYNGFKITVDKKPFFAKEIYALGDLIQANGALEIPNNTTATFIDVKQEYIHFLTNQFGHLRGLKTKMVLDGGNGVVGTVIGEIFDALEFDYKGLYLEPDGDFPNHHPDPTIEENLKEIKKELESGDFEIGFAYDGDADRIAVLTPKNNIKGDMLALLYATKIKNPTVIGEVKCSQFMYDKLDQIGTSIMYKTGHSNLKVKMKETGADLAAEVSGHIFFADRYFGYDDAIYATLRVLELLHEGMDLDIELSKFPKLYSTEEIKVKTTEEQKFVLIDTLSHLLQNPPADFPAIKEIITVDGLRVVFEDGWGLVRASNTTPVLVTRFESNSEENAKLYEEKLNQMIQKAKESL